MSAILDDLLAETDTGEEADQWEFTASTKRVFKFRTLSIEDLKAVGKRSTMWEKRTKENTPHKDFHPFLPVSKEVAMGIAFLEKSLVGAKDADGNFQPLTSFDLLTLANKRPPYFLELVGAAQEKNSTTQYAKKAEEMEELGEFSSGTE